MSAGRFCRVCSCNDERACLGGCAWVDATQDICTVCARAAQELRNWVHSVRTPIVDSTRLVLEALQGTAREGLLLFPRSALAETSEYRLVCGDITDVQFQLAALFKQGYRLYEAPMMYGEARIAQVVIR